MSLLEITHASADITVIELPFTEEEYIQSFEAECVRLGDIQKSFNHDALKGVQQESADTTRPSRRGDAYHELVE